METIVLERVSQEASLQPFIQFLCPITAGARLPGNHERQSLMGKIPKIALPHQRTASPMPIAQLPLPPIEC
ncbi:MAG: hypothetical protein KME38_07675 [Spirirestis rafaelensis WJT71-NPBG6]|nr:hypothetical protein [Spirirestis rafaelensis WJT71-NPBG6]